MQLEQMLAANFLLGTALGVALTAVISAAAIEVSYRLGFKDGRRDILTRVGHAMRENYTVRGPDGRRL